MVHLLKIMKHIWFKIYYCTSILLCRIDRNDTTCGGLEGTWKCLALMEGLFPPWGDSENKDK